MYVCSSKVTLERMSNAAQYAATSSRHPLRSSSLNTDRNVNPSTPATGKGSEASSCMASASVASGSTKSFSKGTPLALNTSLWKRLRLLEQRAVKAAGALRHVPPHQVPRVPLRKLAEGAVVAVVH
eukprot:3730511-Pyramimonas_sp.AAC.1